MVTFSKYFESYDLFIGHLELSDYLLLIFSISVLVKIFMLFKNVGNTR